MSKAKRFQYLGYIIEFSPLQKAWQVLDWDYECEYPIGPMHPSQYAAMSWCNASIGGR